MTDQKKERRTRIWRGIFNAYIAGITVYLLIVVFAETALYTTSDSLAQKMLTVSATLLFILTAEKVVLYVKMLRDHRSGKRAAVTAAGN